MKIASPEAAEQIKEIAAKLGKTAEELEVEVSQEFGAQVISTIRAIEKLSADDKDGGERMLQAFWETVSRERGDVRQRGICEVVLNCYFNFRGDWNKSVRHITDKMVSIGVDRQAMEKQAADYYETKLSFARLAAKIAKRFAI